MEPAIIPSNERPFTQLTKASFGIYVGGTDVVFLYKYAQLKNEENIDFWIECEEFRKMKEGKKHTEQRARDIYNKYLAAQAWKEVNLDTLTRMRTKAAIGEGAGPETFIVAQKKIESLMEKDSYRRFLKSNIFNDIFGTDESSSMKSVIKQGSLDSL
uniref:RGS domain-containing protein n=1 Tax=Parascaris equorum TaxID=6256 RepID=A0A914S1Q6_PAREQ